MNTSLAATVDSSISSISSTTDSDDGHQIKDEIKPVSIENANIRKSINGAEAIAVGIGNGASGASSDKNENAFRAKTNEERIKQEVSEYSSNMLDKYWIIIIFSIEFQSNEEQLLGSLTSMSSPAVRTSARVIQKMKMDSIRPTTPPPNDKKDATKDDSHSRNAQKTPNQTRPTKTNWTQVERNLFFDALNEFGKDFESIAQFINSKQKRKNATDPTYKAKEHVRLLYYQTFTKISKYLRFSDGECWTIESMQLVRDAWREFSDCFLIIIRCYEKGSRTICADQLWWNETQSAAGQSEIIHEIAGTGVPRLGVGSGEREKLSHQNAIVSSAAENQSSWE